MSATPISSGSRWTGSSERIRRADRRRPRDGDQPGDRVGSPWSQGGGAMIGAILLGLFCGVVARMLIPNDAFRHMSGPMSWLVSIVLGLIGAVVGYLIFTVGLGIGDTDVFDWGGVLSALIGTIIVVPIGTWILRRTSSRPSVR